MHIPQETETQRMLLNNWRMTWRHIQIVHGNCQNGQEKNAVSYTGNFNDTRLTKETCDLLT
jgi:hypothetical protein